MSSHALRNVRNQVRSKSATRARVVGAGLPPALSWLVVGLVALGSIRGMIVVYADLDPSTVYLFVAFLLLLVSGVGILISPSYSSLGLGRFKNLVHLNLILGILNGVIDHLVLGYPISLGMGLIYVYVAPYIVFVAIKIPTHYWRAGIGVIVIAIAYSLLENFYQLLSDPEGIQRVIDYNLKLSANNASALSQGGSLDGEATYRVGGYTGSYHDSANILGMAGTFFFLRGLLKRNLIDIALALGALTAITLTQSLSNLVVLIFTLSVFTLYILVRIRATMTLVYLTLSVLALVVLTSRSGGLLTTFTDRLTGDADWGGMLNQLDLENLVRLVPSMLVGHVSTLGRLDANGNIIGGLTEVSLLSYFYHLGFIHTIVLYSLFLYPVWRWFKVRRWCSEALPAVGAISFGFLSLAHYASVFRVTSVFLLCTFMAICLSHVLNTQHPKRMAHKPVAEL